MNNIENIIFIQELFRIEPIIFIVGAAWDWTLITHGLFAGFLAYWFGDIDKGSVISVTWVTAWEVSNGINWIGFENCGYFGILDIAVGFLAIYIIRKLNWELII